MDEAIKHRELVKGLKLLVDAFETLRGPLGLDDIEDLNDLGNLENREYQIGFLVRDAKEALYELVVARQRAGIRAAEEDA